MHGYTSRHYDGVKLTPAEVGERFKAMPAYMIEFVDRNISQASLKITTIKFLRAHLGLTMTEAKDLYEARAAFLHQPYSPYGF